MSIRKVFSLGAAISVMAAISVVSASAQALVQFGGFTYNDGNTTDVGYTAGTLTNIPGGGIPVIFMYSAAASNFGGAGMTGISYTALLTFTSSRTNNATSSAGVGSQGQSLSTFTITGVGGTVNGKNLLSGHAIPAALSGAIAGATLNLNSKHSVGNADIVYTSDFLTFPATSNVIDASLDWVLNGVTPTVSISGNNFANFQSQVAGTFSYTTLSVPEPGVVSLLSAMGVIGSLFALRTRRKKR